MFDDVIDADKVFLAAKLTARVDDSRVEKLCALLLNRVDSRFDLESGMAVESFAHIGDRATEALIGLLIEGELDVRRRAAEALGVIGDGSAVESLIDALHDDDSWVRSEATQALGKIGNKLAVEPLIAAMQSGNSWARINAAKALEKIGGDRAVGSLIAMLQSDDLWVRSSVAISVGEIEDEKVADSLITALQSDDLLALRYTARAFEKIRGKRAGDAFLAALIAALQSGDSLVRMLARAPIIVRDGWAVEPLIGALHDDKSSVRGLAAMALGRIRAEQAVEPLIAALHDDDSSVRRSAAIALGKVRGDRAVELLIGALHDDKSSVRSWAAIALGTIGDDQAVEPLVDALYDRDPSVRSEAAEVLESLCGPMHRGQLEPLLKSGDKDIASAAFEILHSIELKEHGRIKIFKELKYLLRWDDIPENDSDRLLKYLLEACDIAWTERAKIRKSDDKTLIISKDENSAEIKIDERGKKATLKLSDGRTCDLNVRTKKTKSSYTTPSGVMGAEEMLADAHLGALIDRLKFVPDSITVVDYGCGKGALLGRMNEIERELEKIHYIGVDISRGNRFMAGRTAKRYGVAEKLKSCGFMKPDEFFSKNIDVDHVFFSHVIHEIFLKDLPEILYHLLSKMKAGSRITILEQVILVEPERDFVTWSADDFDMLFSDFAESSPRPYQTGRGHELISVDLERLNTDVSLESIRKRCLEVYEHKKERVSKERKSSLNDDGRWYFSELYANIVEQMDEYQKSIEIDE